MSEAGVLVDALAQSSSLSKSLLKKVLAAGGVWQRSGSGKWRRVRRAQLELAAGDEVALYYDPAALIAPRGEPLCLWRQSAYGVYFKPAGMPTQATRAGDRADLMHHIGVTSRRQALPVHRLDTAASGLLLVAHTSQAAALLSAQLQQRQVGKLYQARVAGALPAAGALDQPIDDKTALTRYWTLRPGTISEALVELETGRHHQIRRHFAAAGHPLLGDKRYGGPTASTLNLVAVQLTWQCPVTRQPQQVTLPEALRLFPEVAPPG